MSNKSSVTLSPPEYSRSDSPQFEWKTELLLSMAVFSGLGGGLIGVLSLPVYGWMLLLAGIAAVASLELFADRPRELLYSLGGILSASIALWAVAFKYTRAGLAVVFNAFTRLVSLRELLILAEYEVSVPQYKYAISVTLFLLPPAIMLAILCAVSVKINLPAFPAAAGCAVLAVMFITGSFNGSEWLLLLLLSLCVMLFKRNIVGSVRRALIIPSAVLCAMLIVFSAFAPSLGNSFSRLRINAVGYSHKLKYESAQNPLTEGDLTKSDSFYPSNDVAMTITFDEPTYVYLRGHIKSKLKDGVWQSLSSETYYKNRSLFYQLYQDGFYTDTQLGTIAKILNYPVERKLHTATVSIKGACTEVAYAPYTVLSVPDTMLTDDRLSDLGLSPTEDEYTFEWLPDLVENLDLLEDRFERGLIDPSDELEEYISLENRYRTFVYSEYLGLEDEIRDVLSNYLEGGANIGVDRLNYDNAKEGVRSLVKQVMTYSTDSPSYDGTAESLDKLLSEGGTGYSQQFATLGTVFMRYYGIPARYVEGYLVTHSDAASAEPGQPMDVTMKNAHAWLEYYHDGLGWIPLEITPGFYTDEISEEEPLPEEEPPAPPEKENDPPVKDPDLPEEDEFKVPTFIWALLVLLLLIAAWLMVRKHVLEQREDDFLSSDTNKSAFAMFKFLMRLLRLEGFEPTGPSLYSLADIIADKKGNEYAEIYIHAIDIASKSEFAPIPISDAERSELYDAIKYFTADLDKNSDRLRRFVYRYLLWLY